MKVKLPGLLSHRKNKYTDYLYKPVTMALENWCIRQQEQGEEISQFERAAVCFLYVYDQKQSVARVRDHDNIEEKQMVDAMKMFFLVSNKGLYLDSYHTSTMEKKTKRICF